MVTWISDLSKPSSRGERTGSFLFSFNCFSYYTDSKSFKSHHHIDHVGNPAGFLPTTDLVVGPGFKETELPGYPENSKANILKADYDDRHIRQINFEDESKGLKIGDFRALDWFGDGSFYLLETPGVRIHKLFYFSNYLDIDCFLQHTVDHLAALARTNTEPSRFIFMGGDIGHHPSQWRPNQYVPLPTELIPSLLGPESIFNIRQDVCPCAVYMDNIPGGHSQEAPFTMIRAGHPYDVDMSRRNLSSMEIFDADDDIMVIIAHDWTLLSVLDYWPKPANDWYAAGWKSQGRWKFLHDLIKKTND